MIKKRFNFIKTDRLIGALGLIISVLSLFNISGYKIFNDGDIVSVISYINLLFGIIIIGLVLILKFKMSTYFIKINIENIYEFIKSIDKSYQNIIIQNPNRLLPNFPEIMDYFFKNDFKTSIVGEASHLGSIFDLLSKKQLASKYFNVNSSSDLGHMSVFLYSEDKKKLSIILIKEDTDVLFIDIKDPKLSFEMILVIESKESHDKLSINLHSISKPKFFLDIIGDEKKKYLDNFANLKSGYIPFYGTEVLNIQSSWLENGRYKTIRTLDLTSDPSLLLKRDRYNKANKKFIAVGGTIKRVYLISKKKYEGNVLYKESLIKVINLQRSIGVVVGIQFVDDLEVKEKEDFILYDDFAVLVEGKQADLDYTFGKSTAYFEKCKIDYYINLFDAIWEGKSLKYNSIKQLNRLKI